jgi:hypothetical protein
VLYACRPLRLRELEIALAVRPEERYDCIKDLQEFKTVLTDRSVGDSAGLLLEIKHDAVYLIHQSVKDFLLNNFSSIFMEHDPNNQFLHNIDGETFLARSCVKYLSFRDFESTSLLEFPFLSWIDDSQWSKWLELVMQYPFLEYASDYWYQHIRTPDDTFSFSEDINKILRPKNNRAPVWYIVASGRWNVDFRKPKSRAQIAIQSDIGWLAKIILEDATKLPEEHFSVSHMVRAAKRGSEVMGVLIEFYNRHSSSITTDVLKAAAENQNSDGQLMEVLLDRRGADIPVTAEVVKAAAANSKCCLQIMELLLDRHSTDILIMAEVAKAALANSIYGLPIMKLLLDRYGIDMSVPIELFEGSEKEFRKWPSDNGVVT